MSESQRPQVTGLVFRGYVASVERRSFLPALRERVQPATRELIEKPPFPLLWVESAVVEDIFATIAALRGRDEVRLVVRAAADAVVGPALKSMLKSTMNLFGGSPAALFQQMQALCATMVRHTEFRWQPTGEKSGEMNVIHLVAVADAAYAAWEGTFESVLGAARATGKVGRARLAPDGLSGVVTITWE